MISIKNNKIKMTRGDTLKAVVSITDASGDPYIPVEGDSVRFAVKHATMNKTATEYTDTSPLITKTIPTDTMLLHLEPSDTKSLGFGDYVYDVELTYSNGDIDTFITTGTFTLSPEVH